MSDREVVFAGAGAFAGTTVTALYCGDAPCGPPRPQSKSLAVGPAGIFRENRPPPMGCFAPGYAYAKPLHVAASWDSESGTVFIITAYEPSLDIFEADYKTKRK